MANFLSRIFGSGYEPMTVEQTEKHVAADLAAIIREQEKLKALPDIGLRQQTEELISIVKNHLIDIDSKMNALRVKMAPDSDADVAEKAEMALELEQLQQRRFEASGKILDQLLPRAFAIVRETARRWKDNGQLEVPMSEYDREMLGKYYGLYWQTEEDLEEEDTIDLSESAEDQDDLVSADIEEPAEEEKEPPVPLPDTAVWLNTWPVLDARPTWKMEHYPSQLTAGIMLHKGKISELDNGEGKTLVATLPAYLNALSGSGVHISTANPYLARRDAVWMGPLFAFLGFQTQCLENTRPNSPERSAAYEADITYGTIREFAFDYLRDNTAERLDDQVISRQPHVLILDEIDYILIDEARNSITISGDLPEEQCLIPKELYSDYNAMVVEMVEEQHAIIDQLIQDIQPLIPKPAQMTEDPVGECAIIVRTGAPHYERVNQFLLQDRVEERRARAIRVWEQMPERKLKLIEETLLYNMEGTPTLTESGKAFISERMLEQFGEENFFDLPDIIDQLRDIHSNTEHITNDVLERKEELVTSYKTRNERIKVVDNLLNAHANKYEGKEYAVVPEHTWSNIYRVKIIDETTGRLMEGSRYSSGLHQALEAKHGLEIGNFTKPFATITIQNYCLQYPKLCGMSATAHFDAREYWEIYKLQIAAIRPNAPSKRQDKHNNPKYRDQVYKTRREKYNAVLDHIIEYAQNGRPVLVGAASVFESDYLSQLLHRQGIPHQLLNALQHQDEARMIAAAGYPGMITISTNMAGRGTDILLTPEAIQYGGLAVLGVERHEARRLDYQLSGRAGRQG
ncbi:MAG: hypothetical protein IT269_09380, partial [Saprospiraceae bacterium]|nr:hypothetical protein [Saprospiraceae bacterium]